MTWAGDTFTADDGTRFTIQSERVRGESRFYTALGSWRLLLSVDGSYNKRTIKRRIERAAREGVW